MKHMKNFEVGIFLPYVCEEFFKMSEELITWRKEVEEMKLKLCLMERIVEGNYLDVLRDIRAEFFKFHKILEIREKKIVQIVQKHFSEIDRFRIQLESKVSGFLSSSETTLWMSSLFQNGEKKGKGIMNSPSQRQICLMKEELNKDFCLMQRAHLLKWLPSFESNGEKEVNSLNQFSQKFFFLNMRTHLGTLTTIPQSQDFQQEQDFFGRIKILLSSATSVPHIRLWVKWETSREFLFPKYGEGIQLSLSSPDFPYLNFKKIVQTEGGFTGFWEGTITVLKEENLGRELKEDRIESLKNSFTITIDQPKLKLENLLKCIFFIN